MVVPPARNVARRNLQSGGVRRHLIGSRRSLDGRARAELTLNSRFEQSKPHLRTLTRSRDLAVDACKRHCKHEEAPGHIVGDVCAARKETARIDPVRAMDRRACRRRVKRTFLPLVDAARRALPSRAVRQTPTWAVLATVTTLTLGERGDCHLALSAGFTPACARRTLQYLRHPLARCGRLTFERDQRSVEGARAGAARVRKG